jgi:hypothetical protein
MEPPPWIVTDESVGRWKLAVEVPQNPKDTVCPGAHD